VKALFSIQNWFLENVGNIDLATIENWFTYNPKQPLLFNSALLLVKPTDFLCDLYKMRSI